MKNTKRNSVSPIPDVFVCLGYKDIYDDYDTVDIDKVIEGIPTMSILNYLVEQHDRVLYALSDVTTQKSQILDFIKYVPTNVKLRIRRFVQRNDKCLIYESYGSLMACGYALRNFTPFDEGDEELGLFYGEFEKVFKLLLYCNQKWIDIQVNGGISQNLIEASLKIDLPVVEFKLYKDFKFQIYKAIPFFKFLESDPYYKQILPIFCADKKVNCWQEYIGRIFNFYAQSLNGHFIKVDTTDLHDNIFFNQYCVNINECSDLQEDHRALNYFRDHFLIDCGNKNYMLLNANLLVDKIYQGIRFDIYKTIETNGVCYLSEKEKEQIIEMYKLGKNISEIAKTYLNEMEKAGYEGMLYSSKYYLENVWFKQKYPVWLAHYTTKTNYQGEYKVWQMCSNGRVDGIYGDVDINIMYN